MKLISIKSLTNAKNKDRSVKISKVRADAYGMKAHVSVWLILFFPKKTNKDIDINNVANPNQNHGIMWQISGTTANGQIPIK